MILRLQSEQELQLLQSRIKAKCPSKVHMNELRAGTGAEAGNALKQVLMGRKNGAKRSQIGSRDSERHIPEREVQKVIIGFLRGHSRVAWVERMNSGAGKKKGFYMRFGFVGCPDILGQMKDGRVLAVECKARGGKVTPDQESFLSLVTMWKGVAGVCYSLDDVKALLATN